MKSLNVKNLTIIIFLFISANAFSMTAEDLYNWLNNNPAGKTFNINSFFLKSIKSSVEPKNVNDPVEYYKLFDVIESTELITKKIKITGLTIKKSEGVSPEGFYLPDKLNQCTWVNADKNNNSIIISGQFSGCTLGWYKDNNGHLYTAHIFNVRGKTDQNIEAENFLKDSKAPKGAVVYGFRTAGILTGDEGYGYVIGTFVKGGWKWKWLTISKADRKTIVSCSDITKWDTFPLDDSLK